MNWQGFTLIELAAVLTIIALLAGAVLGGQSLVQAARLRSVGVDAQQSIAAVKQFQERFQSLPGDFPAAASVWGGAACTMDDGSAATEICNGNGNGQIGSFGVSYFEGFHAWKHLARAGLNPPPSIRQNGTTAWALPQSKVENAGFLFAYAGLMSGNANLFNGEYGHALFFGGRAAIPVIPFTGSTSPYPPLYPILTTRDAKRVDAKFDDGQPATGSLRGYVKNAGWSETLCTTSSSASAGSAAAYDVSQASNVARCGLVFLSGF